MLRILLLCCASCLSVSLWAQPANDECATAAPLENISSFCSDFGAFSTEGATASSQASPSCFPSNQVSNDVWFRFTAMATDLSISVIGATEINPGGSLRNPQVAIYAGSCDSPTQVGCASDAFGVHQVQFLINQLTIGDTYYVRVSGRSGQTGTFQMCINNYTEKPEPSGDCPSAVVLCDKSPFTVPALSNAGANPNEIGAVSCNNLISGCQVQENNSAWYKWTCQQSGTLTFTLTPLNPTDDIDFVLYELPNGLDDCSGKQDIRCMASGENVSQPIGQWIACTGATGLRDGDADVSEQCGCQTGNDNFADAVDLVAGRSYALVILNFTQSGSGFTISFGGTSTFLGPQANFTTSTSSVCVGDPIDITDNSSFVGVIRERRWSFGPNAQPATGTGSGPFQISYDRPGLKTILLEVETDRGCIVTQVKTIEVTCCDTQFGNNAQITNLTCGEANDGAIDLNATGRFPPLVFNWSNDADSEDISGLPPGSYQVSVTDETTCEIVYDFVVTSPPPFVFDTLVVMPTCDGGTDGAVTLVTSGATPPYEFNWQNTGFGADNRLDNISQGDYEVTVRDANGCSVTQVLPVRELQLELDPRVVAITPPLCFGDSNGAIEVNISNGLPPYQYDFGSGFGNDNLLDNIAAGDYTVNVLDANRCRGVFEFSVEEPSALELAFDVDNVSCFGLSDGSVTVLPSGGVAGYIINWTPQGNGATIDDLPAGDYRVSIRDANGCLIEGDTVVIQPDSLGVSVLDLVNNICFGEAGGSVTLSSFGGVPPFVYSADGVNFQPDPVLTDLPAGNYTFTMQDAEGCTATTLATIEQPRELTVDAGPDVFIRLGFDTTLQAVSNYFPVTFDWSPIDSLDCLSPDCDRIRVGPLRSTAYTVTVTNEDGCQDTALVFVRIVGDRPLYIPNVFSPNQDGQNDGFTIFGGRAVQGIVNLRIFDRWGNLIYQKANFNANDPQQGWNGTYNGKPLNPGVFVYLAEVQFIDGEVRAYSGDVTLVR